MELMQDIPPMVFRKQSLRIARQPLEIGHHSCPFRSRGKQLVPPVEQFHGSLRRIGSRAMHIHQQLPVEHRQFRMILKRQKVLVHLVARGTDNLHRPIPMHTLLHGPHRLQGRRTARIARTVVVVRHLQRITLHNLLQGSIMAQVGIGPFGSIAMRISHQHDTRTIHTLPQTEVERHLPPIVVERLLAPLQLLGREPYQP